MVLDHLTFNNAQTDALVLGDMNNCTVRNAYFMSVLRVCISDVWSFGGNRYLNNSFFDCGITGMPHFRGFTAPGLGPGYR